MRLQTVWNLSMWMSWWWVWREAERTTQTCRPEPPLISSRNQRFFSLDEVNRAIQPLLAELNRRPFQRLPGSRRSVFETVDHPALKPLPPTRYEFAEWKRATVGIDDHVEVDRHDYSVPYRYARQPVDVRFTATTVELFHRGERLASHARRRVPGGHTTVAAHLVPAHQVVAGWNAQRFLDWAAQIGPQTQTVIERVLQARAHPQQGYRTALGILRLEGLWQRPAGSRLPARRPATSATTPAANSPTPSRPDRSVSSCSTRSKKPIPAFSTSSCKFSKTGG